MIRSLPPEAFGRTPLIFKTVDDGIIIQTLQFFWSINVKFFFNEHLIQEDQFFIAVNQKTQEYSIYNPVPFRQIAFSTS
jgi:hypothetical protein